MAVPILVGSRFGRLVVIARSASLGHGGSGRWTVRCDCGATKIVYGSNLRGGRTTSCGCRNSEVVIARSTKHECAPRIRHAPEYDTWCRMIQRCHNPNSKDFVDYGARGIAVCDRWRGSFEAFLADVGRRPTNDHSIDRIDNDGNYEPCNVRWATKDEQWNNKRTTRWVYFLGKRLSAAQWEREFDLPKGTVRKRLDRGWSTSRALTEPVNSRRALRSPRSAA